MGLINKVLAKFRDFSLSFLSSFSRFCVRLLFLLLIIFFTSSLLNSFLPSYLLRSSFPPSFLPSSLQSSTFTQLSFLLRRKMNIVCGCKLSFQVCYCGHDGSKMDGRVSLWPYRTNHEFIHFIQAFLFSVVELEILPEHRHLPHLHPYSTLKAYSIVIYLCY